MSYSPILGGSNDATFPLQFANAQVSHISMSVTLIEQLSKDGLDTPLAHGTGCLWRHKGHVYLLTARHVFSGTNPFNDAPLSNEGFFPERIRLYPSTRLAADLYGRVPRVVSVVEGDKSLWLQDRDFDALKTDIAALDLGPGDDVFCLNDINDIFEDIWTHIGMECAVVGYPTRFFGGLMTPIWRVGSIASEPLLPVDGKPMFLLDAATSPGFSGSPVFRHHIGPLPIKLEDGSLSIQVDRALTTTFVGFYAGRLEHKHIGGEIPFVFYANRLAHILPA